MGRARKQTAEYFPHFVASGRTMFVLETNWGNDGYAFWYKLLELLCSSDGHMYDCSKAANRIYLTAKTRVPEETGKEILDTLADMEKIDPELWKEKQIIWCQHLVDNLAELYAKRTTPVPQRPSVIAENGPESDTEEDKATTPESQETLTDDAEEAGGDEKKPRARKSTPKPEKKEYAEFVKLTEAEYEKLVAKHGVEKTRRLIETLDNYKGTKQKNHNKYDSDYRAILSWVVSKVEEDEKRGGRGSAYSNSGGFVPSGGFRQG